MVDSLEWLGSNTFKDKFVLSDYNDGFYISTIARNPVLSDSYFTQDYDQGFVYKVQNAIFSARRLNDAKYLLDAYKVQYIFITPDMKSGSVWLRENEGLLFLLSSKSTFQKVYDHEGYEIWQVMNTTISQ
jgi:hypothetical protein